MPILRQLKTSLFNTISQHPSLMKALIRSVDLSPTSALTPLRNRLLSIFIDDIFSSGSDLKSVAARMKYREDQVGFNGIIANYALEAVAGDEDGSIRRRLLQEYRESIRIIGKESKRSAVAIKLSSLVPVPLLEEATDLIKSQKVPVIAPFVIDSNVLFKRLPSLQKQVSDIESELFAVDSTGNQCSPAKIMFDAEESTIQPAIDTIVLALMTKHNNNNKSNNRAPFLLYNTYQMYLRGALDRLTAHHAFLHQNNKLFAAKLVRGAYLQFEQGQRDRAMFGYQITESYAEGCENYNNGIKYALEAIKSGDPMNLVIASHNKESISLARSLLSQHQHIKDHVQFAYLMGFEDRVKNELGNAPALEYVPYGPIEDKVPYLIRRLYENLDILKQK